MTENLQSKLVICLLNLLYSLECAAEAEVNEDFSIKMMEQVGAGLQSLTAEDLSVFLKQIEALATRETDESRKSFWIEFGANFGLSDLTK